MFEFLLITAVLTLTDPMGDVAGADSLQPPTAGVYRNLAPFDLRKVTISDDEQLTLQVEMGSLANPFDLPLGFSLPVIEIYLEERGDDEGRQSLLSGSSMRLPPGRGWNVAVRLTGETAVAYRVEGEELREATPTVAIDGNVLTVRTPFERPRNPQVYAMTGLYDLFGASPWRPLESSESPWAFSSRTQRAPVVDVLARTPAAQRQSIESQVLAPAGSRGSIAGSIWLVLMAVGMFLALVGVAMRSLARGIGQREREAASVPEDRDFRPDLTGALTEPELSVRAAESETRVEPPPVSAPASEAYERAADDVEPTSLTSEERAAFTWDSSALLTQPSEDDFADEFEPADRPSGEAPVVSVPDRPDRGSAVWERPVPLTLKEDSDVRTAGEDHEEDPEVVTDDVAEPEANAAETDSLLEPDPPAGPDSTGHGSTGHGSTVHGSTVPDSKELGEREHGEPATAQEPGAGEQEPVEEDRDGPGGRSGDGDEPVGEQTDDHGPDSQALQGQQPEGKPPQPATSGSNKSKGKGWKRKRKKK